jgi:hypothetical protein
MKSAFFVLHQYFTDFWNYSFVEHTAFHVSSSRNYSATLWISHLTDTDLQEVESLWYTRSVTVTRSMTHSNITVNADTSCDIKLSERRFKTLLSLLRVGGMPINMKSVSTVRTAYNVFITFCYYYTTLCVSVDTFVHRHHLVQAMKKFRVLMGMLVSTWIHLSLRYSTKYWTVLFKNIILLYNNKSLQKLSFHMWNTRFYICIYSWRK